MDNQLLSKIRPYAINAIQVFKQCLVIASFIAIYMFLFDVFFTLGIAKSYTVATLFSSKSEMFPDNAAIQSILTAMYVLPCLMLAFAIASLTIFIALKKRTKTLNIINGVFMLIGFFVSLALIMLSLSCLSLADEAMPKQINGTSLPNNFVINFILVITYFYLSKMEHKHEYLCYSKQSGAMKLNIKSYIIESLTFVALIVGSIALFVPMLSMLGENAFDITIMSNFFSKLVDTKIANYSEYYALGVAFSSILLLLVYFIGYLFTKKASPKRAISFTLISVIFNLAFFIFCMAARDAFRLSLGLLVTTKTCVPFAITSIILVVQLLLQGKSKPARIPNNNSIIPNQQNNISEIANNSANNAEELS